MPGVGRYPCTSCHYVAANRRMLARHSALIHCDKVFKCPACPFITRYAANWYRHKRDLHGFSKLTTCDTCGFFASSTPELVQHKEEEHPEFLQLENLDDNKYAKEKIKLDPDTGNRAPDSDVPRNLNNESDLLLDIYDIDQEIDLKLPPSEDDLRSDPIPYSSVNGHLGANLEGEGVDFMKDSSPDSVVGMNDFDSSENLRPLRIRRSYNCDPCGLLTNNPREYLYHLRNIHGEKIAIHECKYCVYASKHIQKLQRHCNLVHRQQVENDPEFKRFLEVTKDKKSREMLSMGMAMPPPQNENFRNSGMLPNKVPIKNKPQPNLLKCPMCPFQARNKALLFHHEKTVHIKKKNFRCAQCGYVTSEKARYTKHIRYHNLPKLQCEYCFFKTAYKWNMDRHMKNHEVGAEGDFHCPECNFTTSTKQSYNAHVTNHHDPSAESMEDQDIQDDNGENESNEWEDIDIQEEENAEESPNFDSYEFSEPAENSETVWKQGKNYQRNLKCQQCDFRAAWPFELRKHEENHRSQKKHPCPLCGMRFEHIAWLTKHLRRIHNEHAQAKNIAAAFDLLKPARRRPGKEYAADTVLPMFEEVLKQNNLANNGKNQDSKQNSMLSSLLKKPLNSFAQPSASKYNPSFKTKTYNQNAVFKQPRISNYYQKVPPQEQQQSDSSNMNAKKIPTCNVCGYKTRWISELQRHMRVHSQEKPFHCHKCKYVCKWKGDLNRHLLKYHGIQMPPSKKTDGSKFPVKKQAVSSETGSEWPSTSQEKRIFPGGTGGESPLDLTLVRETFPHPNAMSLPYDTYDFESQSNIEGESEFVDVLSMEDSTPLGYEDYKSQMDNSNSAESSSSSGSKLKYQCPQCPFSTTTASRFHVHIVQHCNKRPFMCSVCGYNSNWEFDISKHIRLKNCRDKSGNKACVLLTDESGRRNYEKYEKYLVDTSQPVQVGFPNNSPDVNGTPEDNSRFNPPKHNYSETPSKNCSYDFRNIGSNFEDSSEAVNIVVTPDINLPDAPETQEQDSYQQNVAQPNNQENTMMLPPSQESKSFYCKHCLFKHSTKRVVVSHLSCHAGLKPYRCRVCGVNSNWRHVIVRHVKDIHNGNMNDVEERIQFVQEGYSLRLISFNDDSNNPTETNIPITGENSSESEFSCNICPYKCDKEFYMNFHMKQHKPREGAVYKCEYCPYFVKFKKTLVRHMKLHNPDIDEDIDISPSTPPVTEESQQQYTEYTDDVYEFYDSQTNESADDSIAISFNQLNQLEESPQKIKRHICEQCPYKTDNKTQYLYHKQFHRPNPSAPFKCTSCSYWASMQHLLTQHMRVHSENNAEKNDSSNKNGPQQFFDFFDDKGVAEKISVEWVKKGEETIKMFKCGFCPMMNRKKANVRVHQKMHGVVVNDGRFACAYCNYQCLNQGGLTNHMKVHQRTGEDMFRDPDREYSPRKFYGFEETPARKRTTSYFCFKCPGIFKTANDLQSHSKFHGCDLPLKCTYCDYRAKHKPHITQHLAVHTAEYKAKRKASTCLNASPTDDTSVEETTPTTETVQEVVVPKKIDQMLLLEASEAKGAMAKTGEAAKNLKKCIICPATFFKTSILVYHVSLHGSEGEYKCSHCDYAVNRAENFEIHSLVHPKKSPVKRNLKTFSCTKCPAVFYKQDRFERHSELHGKNYRYVCEHCDYSVRFSANLIKHRKVHIGRDNEILLHSSENAEGVQQPVQDQALLNAGVAYSDVEEKKVAFICDRCPYFQMRKDAVQSHQRRHWNPDGFECPYCDYSSMQNNFLQHHIKLHVQPNNLFAPQAFIKFKSFQIYIRDDDNTEELLFDDENMPDDEATEDNSDCNNIQDDNESFVSVKEENSDDSSGEKKMQFKDSSEQDFLNKMKKRKFRGKTPGEDSGDEMPTDSNLTRPELIKKYFSEIKDDSYTDSNLSSVSCKSGKVPIVVLSDIFANDKDLKKWGSKLKIPKLKICTKYKRSSSSSSERSSKKLKISESHHEGSEKSKKSSKPSLVVKIKVENCRVNKHEKTMYSVSTNSDEHSLKEKDQNFGSAENTNDSISDIFHDTNPSTPTPRRITISPVEDIEENTLTSNPGTDEKSVNSIKEVMGSLIEPSTANDLGLSQLSDENLDMKSDDSFSNDTVPAVSEILNEKLDCLTNLSFKDNNLNLVNGDCSTHLGSSGLNLLQEEIKVSL